MIKYSLWVAKLQEQCNIQGFSNQVVDGIAGPITLAGAPMVRQGATGEITKLIQIKLLWGNYDTNGIDGIFGSGTCNAVRAYQADNGILVDGIVGPETWKKLLGL